MILLADSGSTKTDWRLLAADGTLGQGRTVGFNPYYQDAAFIHDQITRDLLPQLTEAVTEVHYYGTGCTNEEKCAIVAAGLRAAFPTARVTVQSDLVAAARALCGHAPGIACILGTGSNSCRYDGQQIVENRAPLGFWLGDEGSGGHLGKTLVQQFLLGELPPDLAEAFDRRYHLTRLEVLDRAYTQPSPNVYFAAFAKFLFDHRTHPHAYQLIYRCFGEFFDRYLVKYPDYQRLPVHFTGSVAFYHANILRQVAHDRGVSVQNILESPIAGLTLYHRS